MLRGRGHRENKFQIASCKLPDALIKPDESGVEAGGLPLKLQPQSHKRLPDVAAVLKAAPPQ